MTTPADLRAAVDAAPMSRAQIVAIVITFLLSALDGYDVLSVTFAAPGISAEWRLTKAALGIVFAAGLAGMALGAILLAPLADEFGRRTIILVALVLMAGGMVASAFSASFETLAAWRVVTGVGIGACIAVINPVSAEFANARRRPFTVAIMVVGYPVGGMVGGIAAAALLDSYGWRAVFVTGFAAGLVLVPVVATLLPESLAYLTARPRRDGLKRINAVLVRIGQPPVAAMDYAQVPRSGYAALFATGLRSTAMWLAAVNTLYLLTVYFFLSWLPQLVADAGFEARVATLASAVATSAGVAGGLLLGALAQRGRLRVLAGGSIVGFGCAVAAFGLAPAALTGLLAASAVCGFFLFAAASGLYATLATSFPDAARASGTGFVGGVGRVSSIAAPALAGALFSAGLDRAQVSIAFGTSAIVAGLVLLRGWEKYRIAYSVAGRAGDRSAGGDC